MTRSSIRIPGALRFEKPARPEQGADSDDSSDGSTQSDLPSPRRRRKRGRGGGDVMRINVAHCKYDVVHECATELGWELAHDSPDGAGAGGGSWHLCWMDTSVAAERVMGLRAPQRINHFPGMYQICRKSDLARSLGRMARVFPRQYGFYPRTWILPEQAAALKADLRASSAPTAATAERPPSAGRIRPPSAGRIRPGSAGTVRPGSAAERRRARRARSSSSPSRAARARASGSRARGTATSRSTRTRASSCSATSRSRC